MDNPISIWQSLIIALWVAAIMSRSFLGGATLTLRFSPLMTGLVVGLVMGDVAGAMVVTAALQLIFMGAFAPGGTMPYEPSIAAAIAVPVALIGGLPTEAAIGVAVPVGLLGSYLYQFRFFINTFIARLQDKQAEEADSSGLTRSIIVYPTIVSFLLYVPLVFVSLYWGAPIIAEAVTYLEGTVVIHMLEVIGGGLAAIGIATTIYAIGRQDYMVFFLLAYFMSVIFADLNITMVTYAILGSIIAGIFIMMQSNDSEDNSGEGSTDPGFDEDDDDF